MNTRKLIIASTLLTTLFAQSAFAERGDGQRQGHRGPPPEAIEACSSQSEGASCSFSGRDNEQLSGICFAPEEGKLACKPDGHDERISQHGSQRDGIDDEGQRLYRGQ